MFDLHQLRSFCAVIETGRFTKAGRKMHRTQSTISSQIALLEEACGISLLNRLPSGVTPTDSGRVMYGYARRLLDLADEALEKVHDLQESVSGELTIGASTIPGTYILPRLIHRFRNDFPDVTINVRVANSRNIISRVLDQALELGAVGQKPDDARLASANLAEDTVLLALPPGHAWSGKKSITPRMLSEERLVMREEGSGTRKAVDAAVNRLGITSAAPVIQVGSTEAVKESIKTGLGPGFLSSEALQDSGLKTIPVKDLKIKRGFYLTWLKSAQPRRVVQALIDFVKKKGSDQPQRR